MDCQKLIKNHCIGAQLYVCVCVWCMCVFFSPSPGILGRYGDRGGTVVKVLCYKSKGRWFDPRLCQWIFH